MIFYIHNNTFLLQLYLKNALQQYIFRIIFQS